MRKITRSLTTTTHVYSDHPNWGLGEIVGWTGSDALDIIFENGKHCQLNYKYYHAKESIELCYVRLSDVSQLVVFLRERSVCHLVHFTHINNLTSIVKQGILPRTSVKEKGIVSDDTRLDGNEEYGCFSLTYPNYLMLYQKRKRNPGQYIILMIDIEALSEIKEEGILFFLETQQGLTCVEKAVMAQPLLKQCLRIISYLKMESAYVEKNSIWNLNTPLTHRQKSR